jgi:hypothetical protein
MPANYLITGNTSPDYRLIEIYGEEQCKRWEKECPEYLAYQTFEMTLGYCIENIENLKISKNIMEELESLDPVNFPVDEPEFFISNRFNPVRYNLHRSYFLRKYYLIGKFNKVLILYSGEELRKKFNSISAA